MKTIKVSEATNTQLDWLVAIASGWNDIKITAFEDPEQPEECFFRPTKVVDGVEICGGGLRWSPTTNPDQMWPIIDRKRISIVYSADSMDPVASLWDYSTGDWHLHTQGPTGLIAAARCYVIRILGEVVEVPEALS